MGVPEGVAGPERGGGVVRREEEEEELPASPLAIPLTVASWQLLLLCVAATLVAEDAAET